jgi:hypothetical protein
MSQMNLSQLLNFGNVQPNTQVRPSSPDFIQQNVVGGQIQVGEPQRVGTNYVGESTEAAMFFALAEAARGVGQGIDTYGKMSLQIDEAKRRKAQAKIGEIANEEAWTPEQKMEETNKVLRETSTDFIGTTWKDETSNQAFRGFMSRDAYNAWVNTKIQDEEIKRIKENPNYDPTIPENERDILITVSDTYPTVKNFIPFVSRLGKVNGQINDELTTNIKNGFKRAAEEQFLPPPIEILRKIADQTATQDEIDQARAAYQGYFRVQDSVKGTPFSAEALREKVKQELYLTLEAQMQENRNMTPEIFEELVESIDEISYTVANQMRGGLVLTQNADIKKNAYDNIAVVAEGSSVPDYLRSLEINLGKAGEDAIEIVKEEFFTNLNRIYGRQSGIPKNWQIGKDAFIENKTWFDLSPVEKVKVFTYIMEERGPSIERNVPIGSRATFRKALQQGLTSFVFRDEEARKQLETGLIFFDNQIEAVTTTYSINPNTYFIKRGSTVAAYEQTLLGETDPQKPLLLGLVFTNGEFKPEKSIQEWIKELPEDKRKILETGGFLTEPGLAFLSRIQITLRNQELTYRQSQSAQTTKEQRDKDAFRKKVESWNAKYDVSGDLLGGKESFMDFLIKGSATPGESGEREVLAEISTGFQLYELSGRLRADIETKKSRNESTQSDEETLKVVDARLQEIRDIFGYREIERPDGTTEKIYTLDNIVQNIVTAEREMLLALDSLGLVDFSDGTTPPQPKSIYQFKPQERSRLHGLIRQEVLNTMSGEGIPWDVRLKSVKTPFDPSTGRLSDDAIVQLTRVAALSGKLSTSDDKLQREVGSVFKSLITDIGATINPGIQLNETEKYNIAILATLSSQLKQNSDRNGGTIPLIGDADYLRKYAILFGNIFTPKRMADILLELDNPASPEAMAVRRADMARGFALTTEQLAGSQTTVGEMQFGPYSKEVLLKTPSPLTAFYGRAIYQFTNEADIVGANEAKLAEANDPLEPNWNPQTALTGLQGLLGDTTISEGAVAESIKRNFFPQMGIEGNGLSNNDVIRIGFGLIFQSDQNTDSLLRATRFLTHPQYGLNNLTRVYPKVNKVDLFFQVVSAFADTDDQVSGIPGLTKTTTLGETYTQSGDDGIKTTHVVRFEPFANLVQPGNPMGSITISDFRKFTNATKTETKKALLKYPYTPETQIETKEIEPPDMYDVGATILNTELNKSNGIQIATGLLMPMFQEFDIRVSTDPKTNNITFNHDTKNTEATKFVKLLTTLTSEYEGKTISEFLLELDARMRVDIGLQYGLFNDGFVSSKGWNSTTNSPTLTQKSSSYFMKEEVVLPSWIGVKAGLDGVPRIVVNDYVLNAIIGR